MIEAKKISKISDELITFYFENEASNISLEIESNDREYHIKSSSNKINISKSKLMEIEEYINKSPREPEMEDYYWTLAGQRHSSEDLSLIGIMVDSCKIEIDEETGEVSIEFIRKK